MSKNAASTETAKKAAIYLMAAWLIERRHEDYSCIAIARQYPQYHGSGCDKYASKYIRVFSDSQGGLQCKFESSSDERNLRVLALCFMAAMVEAGDA